MGYHFRCQARGFILECTPALLELQAKMACQEQSLNQRARYLMGGGGGQKVFWERFSPLFFKVFLF